MRAILFDLDGTLVDSLDDLTAALAAAMTDHGLPTPTPADVTTWIGGGARNLVRRAVAALAPDARDRAEPVLARFHAHYTAAPVVHTRLYDGIAELLDHLVARGLLLAVLSNKPHPLTVAIGERLLTRWPFHPILGQRTRVPIKPDPSAALAIARELAVDPAACAFVGDSAVDIETGRAAGMHAVGVAWGFRPRAELEAAGADRVVDAPAQLRTLAP